MKTKIFVSNILKREIDFIKVCYRSFDRLWRTLIRFWDTARRTNQSPETRPKLGEKRPPANKYGDMGFLGWWETGGGVKKRLKIKPDKKPFVAPRPRPSHTITSPSKPPRLFFTVFFPAFEKSWTRYFHKFPSRTRSGK